VVDVEALRGYNIRTTQQMIVSWFNRLTEPLCCFCDAVDPRREAGLLLSVLASECPRCDIVGRPECVTNFDPCRRSCTAADAACAVEREAYCDGANCEGANSLGTVNSKTASRSPSCDAVWPRKRPCLMSAALASDRLTSLLPEEGESDPIVSLVLLGIDTGVAEPDLDVDLFNGGTGKKILGVVGGEGLAGLVAPDFVAASL